MRPLGIAAITASSAVGLGAAAHRDALIARRTGLRPNDFDPAVGGWIGRVDAIDSHVLPPALAHWDCRNNRLAHLALMQDGFADRVAQARARYGAGRIATILGTSTSGILSAETAYRGRDAAGALPRDFDYGSTQDLFSLAGLVRDALALEGPAYVVSTACASSARCFIDAANLIGAGLADAAVVGGADTICRMTLHGFRALELIAPGPCRPGDAARDGISIGEAAGFALLEREGGELALLGAGASSDGHHMSSPHPEGAGAASAMRSALDATGLGVGEIDWINLHGTGTRANDASEDLAVAAVFGDSVPASSTKGWTGHTLGACGILEALIAAECIAAGLVPGALGLETPDPGFRARQAVTERRRVERVLSNSFGFGGINCSLVLGRPH